MKKNDEDGRHEAALNIVSRGGIRLVALNKEELLDFMKSSDRLGSYCKLWEHQAVVSGNARVLENSGNDVSTN